MRLGDAYWLAWFLAGFGVPEAIGVATPWPTLTETWHRLNSLAPTWLTLAMHAALAAALVWLLAAHWITTRPGPVDDGVAIGAGALFGLLAALAKRRRGRA